MLLIQLAHPEKLAIPLNKLKIELMKIPFTMLKDDGSTIDVKVDVDAIAKINIHPGKKDHTLLTIKNWHLIVEICVTENMDCVDDRINHYKKIEIGSIPCRPLPEILIDGAV